tara:strand:- start:1569 stop:2315 length:747 start_codon:yes stop_codon:yes gene_type:complete
MLLSVKNLSASIENKKIINDLSIEINEGEVHALMGPNGSGKSTFSNILAGKEDYIINSGEIKFNEENLFDLNIEERSQNGLFLAFQYPVEIPGVNITPFLKAALNAKLKKEGKPEVDPLSFAKTIKENAETLGIPKEMLSRSVNEGFSGGEKKRFEILQMSILKPSLSILDETDSGLDVDALKIVTDGVNYLREPKSSFLIITHYQRLLDLISPDFVHVLYEGKIVKSGDKSIAKEIETNGYKNLIQS